MSGLTAGELLAIAGAVLTVGVGVVRLITRLAKVELKVATLWELVMHELRGRTRSSGGRHPEDDDPRV